MSKTESSDQKLNNGCLGCVEWRLDSKGHRTFWSDANILFIDWDAGYVGLYICQKPLPGQLKYVNLIVNKLYSQRLVLKC